MSLGRYNSPRSHQSCGVFMSDGLFGWIRFLEKHLRDGLRAEPCSRAAEHCKSKAELLQHTGLFSVFFHDFFIDVSYNIKQKWIIIPDYVV